MSEIVETPVASWIGEVTLSTMKEAVYLSKTLGANLEKALGMEANTLDIVLWPADWSTKKLEFIGGRQALKQKLDDIHKRSIHVGDIDMQSSTLVEVAAKVVKHFSEYGPLDNDVPGAPSSFIKAGGKYQAEFRYESRESTLLPVVSKNTCPVPCKRPERFDEYLFDCFERSLAGLEKMSVYRRENMSTLVVSGFVLKDPAQETVTLITYKSFLQKLVKPKKIDIVVEHVHVNDSAIVLAVLAFKNHRLACEAYKHLFQVWTCPKDWSGWGIKVARKRFRLHPVFVFDDTEHKWSVLKRWIPATLLLEEASGSNSLDMKFDPGFIHDSISFDDTKEAYQAFGDFVFLLGKAAFQERNYEEATAIFRELGPPPWSKTVSGQNHLYLFIMSALMTESLTSIRMGWEFLCMALELRSEAWFELNYPRILLARLCYKFTLKYPYNASDFTANDFSHPDPVVSMNLPQFQDGIQAELDLLKSVWQPYSQKVAEFSSCSYEDCQQVHKLSKESSFFHWTRIIDPTTLDYTG